MLKYALKDPFCKLPWNKIYVLPNGQFRNCCLQNGDLGNVLDKSWSEIWYNNILVQARQNISSGIMPEICKGRSCPYLYQTLYKSRLIDTQYSEFLELGLPNTWCNIGGSHPQPGSTCFMCARSSPAFVPDNEEVFWRVIEVLKEYVPHLKVLSPLGFSEIFWKKRLWLVLNKLNYEPYAEQIKVQLTSNATVFNEEIQKEFLDTIPDSSVTFSLDAATPSTYEKIRKLNLFDHVVKNIRNYACNSNRDRTKQLVGVNYNINMLNVHECEDMVKMWAGVPVEGVIFAPTLPFGCIESYPYMVNKTNWQHFRRAKLKILETAEKFTVPVSFLTELDKEFYSLELEV